MDLLPRRYQVSCNLRLQHSRACSPKQPEHSSESRLTDAQSLHLDLNNVLLSQHVDHRATLADNRPDLAHASCSTKASRQRKDEITQRARSSGTLKHRELAALGRSNTESTQLWDAQKELVAPALHAPKTACALLLVQVCRRHASCPELSSQLT